MLGAIISWHRCHRLPLSLSHIDDISPLLLQLSLLCVVTGLSLSLATMLSPLVSSLIADAKLSHSLSLSSYDDDRSVDAGAPERDIDVALVVVALWLAGSDGGDSHLIARCQPPCAVLTPLSPSLSASPSHSRTTSTVEGNIGSVDGRRPMAEA